MEEHLDSQAAEGFFGFFRHLLSTDFMPHGHCYWWRPEIVWLHVVSDALIGLAYFSIPMMLIHFIKKRRDLPFHWMFHLFAGFILCCGTTHFLSIITLWYPIYRLDGVVKAITAAISVVTAFFLFPMIPQALALKSPRELEAKNRELEEAYRKLQELEQSKDAFFANVSHELKTPLALIMAPAESLLEDEFGELSTQQAAPVQTIYNNAARLLQMVGGLLDYSKLEAGKVEMKREPTDIVALTQSIYADFDAMLARRQIRGHLDTNVPEGAIGMDRYLYERVLFNLLSNAVKFTPEGGEIWVTLVRERDRLRLSVRDTGIGISAEDQQRLFLKFSQIETSSTRRFEGSGLGLALVKEFTDLLGGDVSVTSETGKGSTFVAEMEAPPATGLADERPRRSRPAARESIAAGVLAQSIDKKNTLAAKILVAEDNEELGLYLQSLLSAMGEVRVSRDGEAALRQTKLWGPDMILSDVMMPGMDGFALCRAVKEDPTLAAIPVVLLTALTNREALLKGWESGADEYLFKPFHPRELLTRVRSILRLVETRRLREIDRERKEELEQFSYIASHDLKEPLRTLSLYAQLIRKKYQGKLDEDGDSYLDFIIDSSFRMQQLIEDLNSYAVVTTKATTFTPTSTDEALTEALKNLQSAIDESKAEIIRTALPEVSGNRAQLTALLQNLVGNAIKYRGDAPPRVEVSAERTEGEWLFTVKDNGIGFEPQYAEQIFVMFKRLHDRKQYPGTGLGLAIGRRIVERHGGRIWAKSEPGRGSTFYFTLRDRDETTEG